jgi:hypothetical protein
MSQCAAGLRSSSAFKILHSSFFIYLFKNQSSEAARAYAEEIWVEPLFAEDVIY